MDWIDSIDMHLPWHKRAWAKLKWNARWWAFIVAGWLKGER